MIDNHAVWTYWIDQFVFEVHDHMFYEQLTNDFDYKGYFDHIWDKRENACVFGASMGGMTAQLIAIRHPELVDRLLLASTCARLNDTARAVMGRWVECAEAGDVDAFCDSFIDVLYGKEFAQKFGDFIRAAHKNISKEEFKRFVLLGKACASLNAYDFLDRLRCRTLVIGAQNDRVLTAQASVEIAEKLGCGLYLYGSEYGHCVFDEAPDYKDRIYRFFSEQE